MRAYSIDLRKKIVESVRKGVPKSEAARRFGVDRATAKRYCKQLDERSHSDVLFPFAWSSVSRTRTGTLLARRSVGEVEDARAEGLRIHEFQGFPIVPVLEEALATA